MPKMLLQAGRDRQFLHALRYPTRPVHLGPADGPTNSPSTISPQRRVSISTCPFVRTSSASIASGGLSTRPLSWTAIFRQCPFPTAAARSAEICSTGTCRAWAADASATVRPDACSARRSTAALPPTGTCSRSLSSPGKCRAWAADTPYTVPLAAECSIHAAHWPEPRGPNAIDGHARGGYWRWPTLQRSGRADMEGGTGVHTLGQ